MKTIGGTHRQGEREVAYWAGYSELESGEIVICAVFTVPMWTTLGDDGPHLATIKRPGRTSRPLGRP